MKEKRNCKIVQDLLPNYIEHLTNEETNKYIEEHLTNCEDCKKIYENMKKELTSNNNPSANRKKANYFKKYNRKLRVFEISSIILLLIAVGIFVYYTFFWREAYLGAANALVDAVTTYPDTFYAEIEEIETEEPRGEFQGSKTLKVKGLEINEERFEKEFYINLVIDNIGDNLKIEHNGETIDVNQLKIGQKIAVYAYGIEDNVDNYLGLGNVKKIVLLD